jgi:hypothetical protein
VRIARWIKIEMRIYLARALEVRGHCILGRIRLNVGVAGQLRYLRNSIKRWIYVQCRITSGG